MPRYDYRCDTCETVFEVVRNAGDAATVCCPDCDRPAKRVFTPVGVVFKGSGFHNTDYRKRKEPEAKSPECPAKKDGGCSSCPAKSAD